MINANFWTTEGATSLRNILPKAEEMSTNMMKKKRQRKHCDIYFVFLHFAICSNSAKCAHASVTLVLDLTLAPITELQLTNNYSALATCNLLLVRIIGGIYFGVSRKQDISVYDITLAPNVSLTRYIFGLVHVRICKRFWTQICKFFFFK